MLQRGLTINPGGGHMALQAGVPGTTEVLSNEIIPAVPGEFYAYSARFTPGHPIYALLKCKANKHRPISALSELGPEANLFFRFGTASQQPVILPVATAYVDGILSDAVHRRVCGDIKTWIGRVGITGEEFAEVHASRDPDMLKELSQAACLRCEESIVLTPGMIIAVMTSHGKHGLLYVREVASAAVAVDACHILL